MKMFLFFNGFKVCVLCDSCDFHRGDRVSTRGSGRASIRWYFPRHPQLAHSQRFQWATFGWGGGVHPIGLPH